MNKEHKELLLKDLSARLPYRVHCRVYKLNENIKENDDILYGVIGDNVITLKSDEDECLMYYQIKPYLRPLSSMTEEEKKELYHYYCKEVADNLNTPNLTLELRCCVSNSFGTDWLNKHHFDYRGLIERGLAIEVTKENNPYK